MSDSPFTEFGLMQMLADADREAAKRFAHFTRDYQGKRSQPKQVAPQPAQPQLEAPQPAVPPQEY